jgi:hypothetical protein
MNPILVRNINHLTDARYFAAMGVDWMSIRLNADPTSFSKWHMLKDWVAGVKLAAEIQDDDEMLLARTIIDAEPDGIILNQLKIPEVPDNIQLFYEADSIEDFIQPGEGTFIIQYDVLEMDKILQLPSDRIFLQASWSLIQLELLLNKGYTGGICFLGGAEDKTGMRDYGVMDELIGLLN